MKNIGLKLPLIKKRYGKWASFAVWNMEDRSDVLIIQQRIGSLHAKSVIVGLNASEQITSIFHNFHDNRRFDSRLAKLLSGTRHECGYMTDLFKVYTPNAKQAMREDRLKAKSDFVKEMELIGADENTTFVILGVAAKGEFEKWFKEGFKNRIYLLHPSAYNITDLMWEQRNKVRLVKVPLKPEKW